MQKIDEQYILNALEQQNDNVIESDGIEIIMMKIIKVTYDQLFSTKILQVKRAYQYFMAKEEDWLFSYRSIQFHIPAFKRTGQEMINLAIENGSELEELLNEGNAQPAKDAQRRRGKSSRPRKIACGNLFE